MDHGVFMQLLPMVWHVFSTYICVTGWYYLMTFKRACCAIFFYHDQAVSYILTISFYRQINLLNYHWFSLNLVKDFGSLTVKICKME